MQIHEICIHDLKAYENNPRKIPEESINAVATSIKKFGSLEYHALSIRIM